MGKKPFSVSIILPNWNGAAIMQKHLPVVLKAAGDSEVIIVDDGSMDNSIDVVKKKFPNVKLIEKKQNSGFAETVNVGVAAAHGEIIVLLNTDVEPDRDFLAPLVKHFTDPTVFAAGCLEKNPEAAGIVLRGRGIAHWEKGFYIHARGDVDKTNTAWVSGGSGAFRKELWDKLGGLDVLFNPFYWEDIDLSYRALKAGYTVLFEAGSSVWHFHEQGAIKTKFQEAKVQRTAFRNQLLFTWKNLSDPQIWLSHLFWLPIRIFQDLLRGNNIMWLGFVDAVGRIAQIRKQRSLYSHLWKRADKSIAILS